jgi:hypothetical protein
MTSLNDFIKLYSSKQVDDLKVSDDDLLDLINVNKNNMDTRNFLDKLDINNTTCSSNIELIIDTSSDMMTPAASSSVMIANPAASSSEMATPASSSEMMAPAASSSEMATPANIIVSSNSTTRKTKNKRTRKLQSNPQSNPQSKSQGKSQGKSQRRTRSKSTPQ